MLKDGGAASKMTLSSPTHPLDSEGDFFVLLSFGKVHGSSRVETNQGPPHGMLFIFPPSSAYVFALPPPPGFLIRTGRARPRDLPRPRPPPFLLSFPSPFLDGWQMDR